MGYLRTHVAERLLWLDGKPLRFDDHPFMRSVYNSGSRELLLKTGRQIGKTVIKQALVLLPDNSVCRIEHLRIGDKVASLSPNDAHITVDEVTWKSEEYKKPCVEIKTRMGHKLVAGVEHPLRTWDSWASAGQLIRGTRVASVRQAGLFYGDRSFPDDEVTFVAAMIGDGCCLENSCSFTQEIGSALEKEFSRLVTRMGWCVNRAPKNNVIIFRFGIVRCLDAHRVLDEWEIYDHNSYEKYVPQRVFRMDRRQTALFLNRLWATDGHASAQNSVVQLEYYSVSRRLVDGIQRLLWKFGIPSTVRPKVTRCNGKLFDSFVLRVETRNGQEAFINEIGALGKTENLVLPDVPQNNNRDTLPKEAGDLVREITDSAKSRKRRGCRSNKRTLHAVGLRRSPKYALSWPKLAQYIAHFREHEEYPQDLVDDLEKHVGTGLYWDTVTSVKDVGLQDCYDISVRDTGSFVAEGLVTHNSTCCASLMIIDSIARAHFKTLFVSPSREQTSKFSNTRLSKMIHYSPLIRDVYIDPNSTNNVLLQILSNGSEMALSYADDDPDRIRGITADRELIDEVQDIEYDAVIPVVKECMANSDYGHVIYAGTPKSMENTIEFLWQRSTKSEWIMKCPGCGKHQFVDSPKSIGKTGVVCISCGDGLNPREGQWYAFNPSARVNGFHISQPILPKNNEVDWRWERILEKLESYSETKFKNEVLGVSDAIGFRFISQDELVALCQDYFVDLPLTGAVQSGIRAVVGGVDWGGGSNDDNVKSRTVAWVYGLTQEYKLKTLYFKIFPEDNPIGNVREVAHIFKECGCEYVIGDAGGGAVANSAVRDEIGAHRCGQAQYGGGAGYDKLIRFSRQADRYLVNRGAAIDSYMLVMKNKGVIFPNVRQMATPIQDILSEYEEMTRAGSGEAQKKIWRHAPSKPDDCLHAQIYAWLAMQVIKGGMVFYEQRDKEDTHFDD